MGFLDFLGDTMTDSINSANKRINSAFREELRRKNDKEFEGFIEIDITMKNW